MAENTGETRDNGNKITRRDFFKKAVMIGGAVTAGSSLGILAKKEIDVLEKGIETDSGIFFPLYEHHEVGIKPERIPSGLDVLFRESVNTKLFNRSPKDCLLGESNVYNKSVSIRIFPDKILEKTASNGTSIMLGDVEPGLNVMSVAGISSGEFVGGLLISEKLLRDHFKSKKIVNSSAGSHLTRRKFIKATVALGAIWLMAPGLNSLSRVGTGWNKSRDDALDRIMDRLYGMQSNTHPENSLVFFRNLMMADKMLTVAEDIQKETGKKTKMGYQVEYAHNGIEDFLKMGHDFCKMILLSYPKPILKRMVELNNGVEDFTSARLFKLPKNFDIHSSDWDTVTDIRVVDVKLQQGIERKLKD